MKRQKRQTNRTEFLKWAVLGVMLTSTFTPVWAEEGKSNMAFTLEGVTVEAKRPAWESKLSPGTVTVIKPEEYRGEQKTLPDLLKEVPGVHVREVNGKGQYTTVTIRGSTAAQVGIFVDGVLTNLGGDSAVDISTIPVQNVERIEVYRGYTPVRFGGTYMGGVINIVTKKPDRLHGQVEIGKRAYGGTVYGVQVDAPLGRGSFMIGVNRDSSDGDFSYQNYSNDIAKGIEQNFYNGLEKDVLNFDTRNIEAMNPNYGMDLTQEEIERFKASNEAWHEFLTDTETGKRNFTTIYTEVLRGRADMTQHQDMVWEYVKELPEYKGKWNSFDEFKADRNGYRKLVRKQAIRDGARDEIYMKREVPGIISGAIERMDPNNPDNSNKQNKEMLEDSRKKLEDLGDGSRVRRYNDYENTDVIMKWQDKNWTVKGTWKRIDRHLPDGLWYGSALTSTSSRIGPYVDTRDIYLAEGRHQKQDNKELLLSRRQESGKLEWGVSVDYLDQNKKYNVERKNRDAPDVYWSAPFRVWSEYDSDRWMIQTDGTYKLNDKNLLEFLINYSNEFMHVRGSALQDTPNENTVRRLRTEYRQELFNVQVQDTYTLDKKGSAFLTGSIKYNESRLMGRSPELFGKVSSHIWVPPEENQTDGKMTWQLAVKKEINDNLTLRATGGTYYRLLNLYEIVGDGAGILPPPVDRDATGTAFPIPEDGTQADLSILYNRDIPGGRLDTVMTLFWRKSNNMLQLERRGLDYWSYFNDNRGHAHGIELTTNAQWKKFSAMLNATYTNLTVERQYSTLDSYGSHVPWHEVWATFQPKWEGSLRLTYSPNKEWSFYTEGKYTGKMYTSYAKDEIIKSANGSPQDSLFTIDAGIKWESKDKKWQVAMGCNDIFDKGPDMKILFLENGEIAALPKGPVYVNPEYPIQGRTWFVTAKYHF